MTTTATAQIDNDLYDHMADIWWSEHGFAALLRHINNPWRVGYFKRLLAQRLNMDPGGKRVLDIGCGGGLLAEEFAAMGCSVTGLDPSSKSVEVAREHAAQGGLAIDYRCGTGENLPFDDASFDIVCCCDVLEHIREWRLAVGEAARVLKPGGVFFFDTINRTTVSKIIFIKMGQQWRFTRFMPPNLHVWEMFIKPEELTDALARFGLRHQETRGVAEGGNPIRILLALRKYTKGKITAAELVERMGGSREGPDIEGIYMGYAVKP